MIEFYISEIFSPNSRILVFAFLGGILKNVLYYTVMNTRHSQNRMSVCVDKELIYYVSGGWDGIVNLCEQCH